MLNPTKVAFKIAESIYFPDVKPRDVPDWREKANDIDQKTGLPEIRDAFDALLKSLPISWHTDPKNAAVRNRAVDALAKL